MKNILTIALLAIGMMAQAQEVKTENNGTMQPLKKIYDESIDPMKQIDEAVAKAKVEGKNVICQVGGNWCVCCLRFANFITKDEEIAKVIADNFVYAHVNYPRKGTPQNLMTRLNNPGRFGYPVFVVLDSEGKVIHTQDSSFLEEGQGYDKKKVLRFLNSWTPTALN